MVPGCFLQRRCGCPHSPQLKHCTGRPDRPTGVPGGGREEPLPQLLQPFKHILGRFARVWIGCTGGLRLLLLPLLPFATSFRQSFYDSLGKARDGIDRFIAFALVWLLFGFRSRLIFRWRRGIVCLAVVDLCE